MKKNHFISGEWNVTCDVCSRKIKAHEAKQRWDGFIVCPDDFEHRHPQDFVKAKTDKITVPFIRSLETPVFLLTEAFFDSISVEDNNFNSEVLYNRDIIDTITLDDLLVFDTTKAIQEYIDMTESITFVGTGKLNLIDAFVMEDSGFLGFSNYIDPIYFAEFYVGTTTLF